MIRSACLSRLTPRQCRWRYALFTLVGIAGEDDLDAPDLNGEVAGASAANGAISKAVDIAPFQNDA